MPASPSSTQLSREPSRPVAAPIWQAASLRLAVALAFADASIVVLALPQLVDRLHAPISHVTWVIMAYNLALVLCAMGIVIVRGRVASASKRLLVAGLVIFGLASIGCGASDSLGALIPLRCVQGVGGGLLLCGSLPLFAATAGPRRSPLHSWSAAAAIGAAIGPAIGGVLTQVFDWRSIFFAQAPVAALAAVAVLLTARGADAGHDPHDLDDVLPAGSPHHEHHLLDALTANAALALLSAGLIGALFLVVIELINAWRLTPIAAAGMVTAIPLATAATDRLLRGRAPTLLGAAGAALLAVGLLALALVGYRQLGWVLVALGLCGTGLGLGFTGLTEAALRGEGTVVVRAARTVAARDAGLLVGLLILTPVFVAQVNDAAGPATQIVTDQVLSAPIPLSTKFALGQRLEAVAAAAPQSSPPNIRPTFKRFEAGAATPAIRVALIRVQREVQGTINAAVTHAFKRPFLVAGGLALLVLPLLGLRLLALRRRAPAPA